MDSSNVGSSHSSQDSLSLDIQNLKSAMTLNKYTSSSKSVSCPKSPETQPQLSKGLICKVILQKSPNDNIKPTLSHRL